MSTPVDPGRATEARLRQIIQKRDAFLATAIGRAFNVFDVAHSEACRVEVEQTYEPFPKLGIVRGKREAEKAARAALLRLLYVASGVGKFDDGR